MIDSLLQLLTFFCVLGPVEVFVKIVLNSET